MKGSAALSGVSGDATRDDAGASREVADDGFFGRERMIPGAYSGLRTPIRIYHGGAGSFSVLFGTTSAGFEMWTDVRGLDAIIDSCMAAKVRAA